MYGLGEGGTLPQHPGHTPPPTAPPGTGCVPPWGGRYQDRNQAAWRRGFREDARDAGRDPRDLERLAAVCRTKVAGGVSSIVLDTASSSDAALKYFCGTVSGEIHTITLDTQVGPSDHLHLLKKKKRYRVTTFVPLYEAFTVEQ